MNKLFFLDPRAENFYLIHDSPLPILTILAAYFVLFKFGPIIMSTRKPFELNSTMTAYNFIQVVANSFLAIKVRTFSSFVGLIFFNFIFQVQFLISLQFMKLSGLLLFFLET